MRSVLARASIPCIALCLLSLPENAAHAAGPRTVTRGGTPWVRLGGPYAGPRTNDLEGRARAIVAARFAASSPKAALPTLAKSGIDRFGDGESVVRFAQLHRGLPVIGRGVSVRLSAAAQPIETVTDLEPSLPASIVPLVTADGAANAAAAATAFRAAASESHLVVWPTVDRGARLAYAVLPHVPTGIPVHPRVIVDAETGEVLEARDLTTFATADVYPFNPTKTPELVSRELSLTPTSSTLTNPFIEATNCIDNKSVKSVDFGGFKLKVHTCDLEQVATATGGHYSHAPSDVAASTEARTDAYSELSIYYHTSTAYTFFRTLQGDADAQVVVDKPLRLIANLQVPAGMLSGDLAKASDPELALETFQNAFFSPAGGGLGSVFQQLYGFDAGALWFGQGPKRDYAYDGDVVYHEFVHAVVDDTLKLVAWHVDARGAIDSPGAMNEGLADYFSSAITGDPDVGEYAAFDMGAPKDQGIRSLANTDACPNMISGEVHFDSTLFSGGLWQARQSLPTGDRSRFDAALYKTMRSNAGRGDLGFDDLTKLFVATLDTDFPAGSAALEKAMTDRGVLPGCERILAFTGAPVSSPYKRAGFVAPGKQSVNVKGTAPGIVQISAALPPSTATVTVSFDVAKSSGGAAGLLGGSGKPFTPVVLVKLGAPITWDPTTKKGHDADQAIPAKDEGNGKTATIEIPAGTTAGSIYLQIASTGDSDGSYDAVKLLFTETVPEAPVEEEVPPPAPAVVKKTESGCSSAGVSGRGVALPTLLGGALAIVLGRRRRTRR